MEEKLKYTYSSQSFIESEMTEAEITAGYITNTGTLFVYAPYVYWGMVVYQNVTQ